MDFWQIMAAVTAIIIGIMLIPLMTIGVIFIMAGWNIPGIIFLILGLLKGLLTMNDNYY